MDLPEITATQLKRAADKGAMRLLKDLHDFNESHVFEDHLELNEELLKQLQDPDTIEVFRQVCIDVIAQRKVVVPDDRDGNAEMVGTGAGSGYSRLTTTSF